MPTPTHIALLALNARYTHCNLAARYLMANMAELQPNTHLIECNINQPLDSIVDAVVDHHPAIIGIGVYIWNRPLVERLIPFLRAQLPQATIIAGGPEISHDTASSLAASVDCVICGEADTRFAETCRALVRGESIPPCMTAPPPTLASLKLPYEHYTPHDLAHRAIYIESSRGCPHTCHFCLSSLDSRVRSFPEEELLGAIDTLIDKGVRNMRMVDRSFNLGGARACRLLDHVLARLDTAPLKLHLELTPDELNAELRTRLTRFPPNSLHVEVGIQTLDSTVSARIGRPMSVEKVAEGVQFLVSKTSAELHADLIAGLPGETPESFAAGFNRLYSWEPNEIQVGILKGLPGTPIFNHVDTWGLRFSPTAPYPIQETSTMPAAFIDGVERFAAHWERIANRNHLPRALRALLRTGESPWHTFDAFSRHLYTRHGLHGIDLIDICRELKHFMEQHTPLPCGDIVDLIRTDYTANGRRGTIPRFLQ